jgi:signal transduction histidine kinase
LGLLFYFQEITNREIRSELFENEKETQVQATKSISEAIRSNLDSIRARLHVLAVAPSFQQGELDSPESLALIGSIKAEMDLIAPVDAIYALDKDHKVVYSSQSDEYLGVDMSSREYVKEVRSTMKPVFSNAFTALDNSRRITVAYPIINQGSGEYLGMVGAGIIADPFFSRYGNIRDFNSGQYLNALDQNHVFIASPNKEIVGTSFDDPAFRERWTKNDPVLIDTYTRMFSGQSVNAAFDVGFGERLVTGEPVTIDGSPQYFVLLGIPTSIIYEKVDSTLVQQATFQLYQIIAIIVGVATLTALLVRNNSYLGKKVQERTSQLEESNANLVNANSELADAYEQLKVHDRLQKEFVNVAAHELRTPIQPLLGAAELIEGQFADREKIEVTRPEIEMILRNAKRLERLSADILEISRIESGALRLNEEDFSLAYMIADAVRDAKIQSMFDPDRLAIAYNPDDIFVHADREKITQVITNILTNAIKFTKEGTISITTQRDWLKGLALIQVKDTGSGIDAEIIPKLFEKFVTKSEKGTGIGLFISKKIVEAHGGTISGWNNPDSPGAIFKFTLPLAQNDLERERHPKTPS